MPCVVSGGVLVLLRSSGSDGCAHIFVAIDVYAVINGVGPVAVDCG